MKGSQFASLEQGQVCEGPVAQPTQNSGEYHPPYQVKSIETMFANLSFFIRITKNTINLKYGTKTQNVFFWLVTTIKSFVKTN